MHIRFKDNLGALSIRVRDRTYKHCGACGYRLECIDNRLQAHFRRYHGGAEPAWLSYGDPPVNCCYSNF